jgi:hypothetical protein
MSAITGEQAFKAVLDRLVEAEASLRGADRDRKAEVAEQVKRTDALKQKGESLFEAATAVLTRLKAGHPVPSAELIRLETAINRCGTDFDPIPF